MASSSPPSRFFMTRHHTLPDRFEVGGISIGMPSGQRYSKFQPSLTRPSWLTTLLPTSLQPTKQPWLASLTGSFRCSRPKFVDLHFHHGLTRSVALSAARPADSKDHIDAPSCLPIALSGCGSCETCIAV